ncbi:MAG: RNA polymerase II transcription factor B subunit 1 [Watsoniomyces obsoletus]|nr:MAG: RNA polymerase II transcription factor B subunit 1 [Watsoniomyces obsoletus]
MSHDVLPPAKSMVDGYISTLSNMFDDLQNTAARKSNRRSAMLMNVNDPVAMHLLVSTALGDSKDFQALSFEEVEALKGKQLIISSRVEATKRKLLLESKVRDAAQSLCRLYTKPGSADSDVTISTYQREEDATNKAVEDHRLSQQKCEDLAQELWQLEKGASEIKTRMLQHTAAVLQMNHVATSNGHESVPGSKGRGSIAETREMPNAGANGHGRLIPRKSVARDSNLPNGYHEIGQPPNFNQSLQVIRDIEHSLQELNSQMRKTILEANPHATQSVDIPPRLRGNSTPEALVEHAHSQLRYLGSGLQTIHQHQRESARYIHESESSMAESLGLLVDDVHRLMQETNLPDEQYQAMQRGATQDLQTQLDYLQRSLHLMRNQSKLLTRDASYEEKAEQYETVVTGLWDIITSGEGDERQRGTDSPGGVSPMRRDSIVIEPYSLQAFSAKIQWLYSKAKKLEQEKDILRRQIQQQRELSQQSDTTKDAVVTQLTEELEHLKIDIEEAHKETANAKQEMTMTKQEIARAQQETTSAKQEMTNAQQELSNAMERLNVTRRELAMREQQRADDDSSAMNGLVQRQEEIFRLESELQGAQENAEKARKELQTLMKSSEERIQYLQTELQRASQEKERLVASHGDLSKQIDDKVAELDSGRADFNKLEGEVVRLQTEATVARAELDGAYGARNQRGGPSSTTTKVILDPKLQQEMDELARRNMSLLEEIAALRTVKQSESSSSQDLQQRVDKLQKELSETIDEYELMTKQSVEFERDREQLENTIDGLRERCEAAENQLHDEKLKWIGSSNHVVGGGAGMGMGGGGGMRNGSVVSGQNQNQSREKDGPNDSTSTMVLRNEFRKMMKEMKAESMKALKAEQEERRRLEALVRALKKEKEKKDILPGRKGSAPSILS